LAFSLHLHNKHSMSHSLLDPNQLHRYFNRIKDDGNAIQTLCALALDNDFPNIIDLADLPEVRRLFKISDDATGLVVFNLVQMLKHHPKYVKHGEDLAAVHVDALHDIAFMGMSVDGQWGGVQIHKNHGGFDPDDLYPIVICHPALAGKYEQAKDLVSSSHYTAIIHVNEKPTAAVGSYQDELNKKGLTRPSITHKRTRIVLGEYPLEEGKEIRDKAKTILEAAKKESKARDLPEPTADDVKYVWEQKKLRKLTKKGSSYQSKPAGFVILEAYGLDPEEDGKMSAEELAASASAEGLKIFRIQHKKIKIVLGEYPLKEGNEIKDKAKTILVKAKKECTAKDLSEPTVDDMKYVWEQLDLRQIKEREGRGYQSKPAGFVNLESYGLDLPEFATDYNNSIALETMASSETEEDGKMSAEELAASASTSANVAGRKRKNTNETNAETGGVSNTIQFALSSEQMEMMQSLHSAEAAIAAGKMNADEVFPNYAAVSNAGMASANPSNYAEV
jgi:hypothetical protein